MKIGARLFDDQLNPNTLNVCIQEAESSEKYLALYPGGDGSFGYKFNWMIYDQTGLGGRQKDWESENFKILWNEIKDKIFPESEIVLHRCYINAHNYGVEDSIHVDDQQYDNGYTVIVYLCNQWYPEWFGQTVFFSHGDRMQHNEIMQSVMPKNNRLLIFDKNIPHCVTPLSRRFTGIRYTCMYKVEVINEA